jgi:hypothetical protein
MIAIGGHIDRDGWGYPSLATIAALTGIAREDLPRVIVQLEDSGLLHRDRSAGGRRNSTRYWLDFKGPETSAPEHTFLPETVGSPAYVSTPKRMLLEPETSAPQQTKHKEQTLARETRARANGLFMDFWQRCPPRDGDNPKEPASREFEAALDAGVDPELIIDKAAAWKRSVENIDNRRFVKQAVTWLRAKGWEDDYPEPAPARPYVPFRR